jgi:hypothetical protein
MITLLSRKISAILYLFLILFCTLSGVSAYAQEYYLSFPSEFDCTDGNTRKRTMRQDENLFLFLPERVPLGITNPEDGWSNEAFRAPCAILNNRLRKIYSASEIDKLLTKTLKKTSDNVRLESTIRHENDRSLREAIDQQATSIIRELLRDEKFIEEIVRRVVAKIGAKEVR